MSIFGSVPPSLPHRKYRHQQSALSISSEEKSNVTNGSGSINLATERTKKQSVKYSNIASSTGTNLDRDATKANDVDVSMT
jgi:hypothetical protein